MFILSGLDLDGRKSSSLALGLKAPQVFDHMTLSHWVGCLPLDTDSSLKQNITPS